MNAYGREVPGLCCASRLAFTSSVVGDVFRRFEQRFASKPTLRRSPWCAFLYDREILRSGKALLAGAEVAVVEGADAEPVQQPAVVGQQQCHSPVKPTQARGTSGMVWHRR